MNYIALSCNLYKLKIMRLEGIKPQTSVRNY